MMGADDLTGLIDSETKSENILRKPLDMKSVLEAVERNAKLH
jgi:hypothetical protein